MISLARLEVVAFRGFARPCSIPLDCDAIVVTGANGLGKTSLTDALMWLITGQLPQMPERQGRRGEEFVVNRYREGEDAIVTLWLHEDDTEFAIQRRGSSKRGSTVSVETGEKRFVGEEADQELCRLFGVPSIQALDMAVQGWGILRQDAMRAVLNAPPEAFHARLRDILGLGILERFERAAKEAHRHAAEEAATARRDHDAASHALARAESEAAETRQRVFTTQATQVSHDDLVSAIRRLGDVIAVDDDLLRTADGPRTVWQAAAQLERDLRSMSARQAELRSQIETGEQDDSARLHEIESSIAPVARDLEIAQEGLLAADQRLASARAQANRLAELASLAIPLLADRCPVCDQGIDPDPVAERLRVFLAGETGHPDLVEAVQKADDWRARVGELTAVVESQARAAELVRTRIARRSQATAELNHQRQRLAEIARTPEITLPLLREPEEQEGVDRSAAALVELQRLLEPAIRSSRERAVEVRLPRLEQQLTAATHAANTSTRKLEAAARRESEAKLLADAATAASLDVTEDALAALDPYFGEVFGRLAAHPTFSELGLQHDVYYGKAKTWARLSDPVGGVEANPQLILSEGQLNVVALSYFVAFALTAGEKALPFIILDDPLQSMDDMNVLGFADLCRHLRDSRQVIVTTHDARFATLLQRKLKPRREGQTSGHLHFVSWDRSGPELEFARFTADTQPLFLADSNGSAGNAPS